MASSEQKENIGHLFLGEEECRAISFVHFISSSTEPLTLYFYNKYLFEFPLLELLVLLGGVLLPLLRSGFPLLLHEERGEICTGRYAWVKRLPCFGLCVCPSLGEEIWVVLDG